MKNIINTNLLLALFLTVSGTVFAAGEKLVAEWNFAKGTLSSTNGKYKGRLMGKTSVGGNARNGFFLAVGKSGKNVQEGMLINSKAPALAPANGFRLEMSFRMWEATSTQPYLMLWDNKGIPHSPNAPKASWHQGFCLFLVRRGENTFQVMSLIGHGKYSSTLAGKYIKLEEGVKHTILLTYDGISRIDCTINGKDAGKVTLKKGGKVAPPCNFLNIGDRTGSGPYYRFDGEILSAKLYAR